MPLLTELGWFCLVDYKDAAPLGLCIGKCQFEFTLTLTPALSRPTGEGELFHVFSQIETRR
jgi:hypothetical protein